MKILLATLCLNEMEHLPKLYEQHKDWPGLARWVFVEAADKVYAETNPELVTPNGLSVDGTSEFLAELAAKDSRVAYVPHGLSSHKDPAQGKVAARQRYLDVAEGVRPDFVVIVDADEFYTKQAQGHINHRLFTLSLSQWALRLPQRHIWRPPSIADQPLFNLEVIGGYWGVKHCRIWRWRPKMRYVNNHNTPQDITGLAFDRRLVDSVISTMSCIHLGFASSVKMRAAKHKYYVSRGEGIKDKRQRYVDCRAAFETWQPGVGLPDGARVVPYTDAIPECFQ